MAEDKIESELPEIEPRWIRCLNGDKASGICSIESMLNKAYIRNIIIIPPWGEVNTGIKDSCLFFVQNASSTWEVSCAIMYGSTEGVSLNTVASSGFFGSGKPIDVYRPSTPGDIIIKNNTSYDRAVYFFALKLFS